MIRLTSTTIALAILLTGCYRGPDPDVTDAGKGRPRVTATAPETAEPGATVDVVVTVSNPGPGDMPSIVVAFSRVGDPQLPAPIVDVGRGGTTEGIASVEPEADVISPDGVRYRFGALPEGEELAITFELRMPRIRGAVGNAITVYDGNEPERARGTRLLITLE